MKRWEEAKREELEEHSEPRQDLHCNNSDILLVFQRGCSVHGMDDKNNPVIYVFLEPDGEDKNVPTVCL